MDFLGLKNFFELIIRNKAFHELKTISPVCSILQAIFCLKTLWDTHYRTNIGCCEGG